METTTNLSFHVIDVIENKGTVEYENLAKMFVDSEEDLCMKKMSDGNFQKVINLYDRFIPTIGFLCDYVYYIKQTNINSHTIIAFAFVSYNIDKIYTVDILCSHKNKDYVFKGKTPGMYLLDRIYEDFVVKKGILRIYPATLDLIPYYKKWKIPSYSSDDGNFLLYFESDIFFTDKEIYELLYDANSLKLIKEYFSIPETVEVTKEELTKRIKELDDGTIKKQLNDRLKYLEYFTIREYKDYIKRGHYGGMRKNSRRKTSNKRRKTSNKRRKTSNKRRKTSNKRRNEHAKPCYKPRTKPHTKPCVVYNS